MQTVKNIFQFLNVEHPPEKDIEIHRVSQIQSAAAGDISFVLEEKFEKYIAVSNASAILVGKEFNGLVKNDVILIKVDDVRTALSKLLLLFDRGTDFESGISKLASISGSAIIAPDAAIGNFVHIAAGVIIQEGVSIGAQVFLGEDVKIGRNTRIYPGVKIYHGCVIGDNVIIHANTVIGSDGFGFNRQEDGTYSKIPQVGNVVIGNHVEIGANTVIDRSSFGSTIIEDGVKLDNLIQVGHNVKIGANTVIAAQTGISGSVNLGKNCVVGGQVAFVPHIGIADGSQFQGQSGVGSSIRKPGGKYFGSPAIGFMNYIKSYSVFKILPELEKKILRLEKEIQFFKKEQNGKQKNN